MPEDFFDFREYYQPDIVIGLPQGNFTISGDITVDEMALFSLADRAFNRMLFSTFDVASDEEEQAAAEAANRAHDLLIAMIKTRNEHVPDDLKLLPGVCLGLIAKLSKNVSATYEIVNTLTLGVDAARAANPDAPAEKLDELDADLESGAPLAPQAPSPPSSSTSSEETAGSGTGGEGSLGGSSRATSEPQPQST